MNLDTVIKHALLDIPEYCTADVETHEWVIAYGDVEIKDIMRSVTRTPTKMLPYYVCKHCHAVSDLWTMNKYPKRVR